MSTLAAHSPALVSTKSRGLALLVAGAALALLIVAARLDPSPDGLGTHRQIGLPPCGWIIAGDIPCPSCGMTTAFAHATDGHILRAMDAQPMGALLAIATGMSFLACLWVAATGAPLARLLRPLLSTRTGAVVVGFALLAWIYKILRHKGML